MSRTEHCLAAFLVRHYRVTLASFLLLTLAGGWFARQFEIDASAETLLVKNNRLYIEARLNNRQFSPDEFILVGYRPHDGNIYSAGSLADLRDISSAVGELERVERVVSILNVPLISEGSGLTLDTDPQTLTLTNRSYSEAELRQIFTDHPVFTDLLVNGEQTATALQVVFSPDAEYRELDSRILDLERELLLRESPLPESQASELQTLQREAALQQRTIQLAREAEIEAIYAAVEPYRANADIFLGGGYVLAKHLVDIIRNDLVVFGSAISLLICVLLFVMFRDIRWVLIPILCCFCSVLITMGLFGFLGFKTTVISSNFIALQLILTLALVVHLIVQYQHLARDCPELAHAELLERTVALKTTPCLFAGITTSVGFASLLFSNIQPVISFGWMMIVAMATSIAVSLVLFPGVLMLFRKVLPHRKGRVAAALVEFCHRLTANHAWLILVASAVLLAFGVTGLGKLNVENSFLNYFRADTQVRQELVFIDREFGGSTPLDIVYTPASGGNPDLVVTAATLATLQSMQATLETSPAVGKAMSVVNFTELARKINNDRPLTEYELNSVYLLLDRELRESLVGSYLDTDTGALRISTRIIDSTEGLNRREFLGNVHAAMGELGGEGQYTVTNLFVLYQDILQRLYESQILTLGLVYVALGLIMMLLFRSVRIGLIALVPNVLTTLFILGFMGWFAIPLDLMTITIAAIAMGIAVDDTIHFTHQFREDRAEGAAAALGNSFHKVGLALLYTSAIIAVGFSVLGFSDFVPGIYFGLLTALAMLIALLTDLTLLPVMLRKFSGT